jgi:acetoin utilization protein AcuB
MPFPTLQPQKNWHALCFEKSEHALFMTLIQGGLIMLVQNWMSKNVVTIDVEESMEEAVKLMKKHGIKMLPVMKKGKLAGIVTDRDLKRAQASDATSLDIHELLYLVSTIKIGHVMSKNPITVPIDFTIEETADILMNNEISGAPVVDSKGHIVGTISQNELFRALISLSGFGRKGIQFAFLLEDRPGSIKEVADIIRKFNARMVSILSTYDSTSERYRKVIIRIHDIDRRNLSRLKEELKQTAQLLYMVDHRDNIREIYQ